MIDDKELEERADKYINSVSEYYGPWDIETFAGYACPHCMHYAKDVFIAGARSQDEIAYQRGRQKMLDEVYLFLGGQVGAAEQGRDIFKKFREKFIIDQLKTGGKE